MPKTRLDVLVVERGLTETRAQAQRLIRAGLVRVGGQVADKPGARIPAGAEVAVEDRPRFVSRGGEKLDAALMHFGLDVSDMVAADVGASTGGFTDCLLQHGARRVYAIDVGYGQLDWRLRNDSRVVVMERTNARYLKGLPESVDLVTIDVSFISLALLFPTVVRWLPSSKREGGHLVALVKPQFEAGRRDVGKGGVVRDPEVHRRVLARVLDDAAASGLCVRGLMASPLRGRAGNTEFLGWWELGEAAQDPTVVIEACLAQHGATAPAT
jgi:23S rRNA (cytidine1920-2'-O)/16S rRNA (cytidine1409-2'-O)-methyltransferase